LLQGRITSCAWALLPVLALAHGESSRDALFVAGVIGTQDRDRERRSRHCWFWLNISDTPFTITLTVSGHQDKLINYGIIE
jgi:hypothetical protein